MKLGIHAYAWCSQWSNETLHLADKVKALGLDFIEIPLMCLETLDAVATRARLEANALDVCTSTVLLEGTDITSDERPPASAAWITSRIASRRPTTWAPGTSPA